MAVVCGSMLVVMSNVILKSYPSTISNKLTNFWRGEGIERVFLIRHGGRALAQGQTISFAYDRAFLMKHSIRPDREKYYTRARLRSRL